MSKRVWAIVPRSGSGAMTDKTPVIVWEHELPLLKEVHGTEPQVIEDLELAARCEREGRDRSATGKKIGRDELARAARERTRPRRSVRRRPVRGVRAAGARLRRPPRSEDAGRDLRLRAIRGGAVRQGAQRRGARGHDDAADPHPRCAELGDRLDAEGQEGRSSSMRDPRGDRAKRRSPRSSDTSAHAAQGGLKWLHYRSLGELRQELQDRLGFGSAGSSGNINRRILNSFLRDAQWQLYWQAEWPSLTLWADFTIASGAPRLPIRPTSNTDRILRFGVNIGSSGSPNWHELREGIDLEHYNSYTTPGLPGALRPARERLRDPADARPRLHREALLHDAAQAVLGGLALWR